MTTLDTLLDRVEVSPDGPKVAAVFDYDGTLIDGFSGVAYYTARARALEVSPKEVAGLVMAGIRGVRTPEQFDAFLDWWAKTYEGRRLDELEDWSGKVFDSSITRRLRPESWQLLEAHRKKGHTIVIASSATMLQIGPIAKAIGADHILCTMLEVEDGVLTGRVAGRPLWAEEKPRMLRELGEEIGLDLVNSFAYADGDEDTPLLESVGNPTAVNPKPHMERAAKAQDWPILEGRGIGGLIPNPRAVVGTLTAVGGFVSGAAIGAGLGLLRRSRRTFINSAMTYGSDLGLALAGVEVDIVEGREHLWSDRPCVFIFNHRSNLDGIVMMQVVREEVTAVAKKELLSMPGIGLLFRFSGVAFIDRADRDQIREALKPAVRQMTEEGISLVIAPEGTRWKTPGMGPFKKGAFHIARQAGVSVVPIVIRGTGSLLPRGETIVQPGRIEVAVLPPVDVSAWEAEELAERIAEVRDDMLRTLLNRG